MVAISTKFVKNVLKTLLTHLSTQHTLSIQTPGRGIGRDELGLQTEITLGDGYSQYKNKLRGATCLKQNKDKLCT